LKNVSEYRIDTMTDVKVFHEQLQEQAREEGYTLNSFSWTEKSSKVDGAEESYYVVKASFVFNVAKNPENYSFSTVTFPTRSI
jgi:hypothetical protein